MTIRGKRPSAVMPLLSLVFDINTETDGCLEEFGTPLVTIGVKKTTEEQTKLEWETLSCLAERFEKSEI